MIMHCSSPPHRMRMTLLVRAWIKSADHRQLKGDALSVGLGLDQMNVGGYSVHYQWGRPLTFNRHFNTGGTVLRHAI